MLITASTFLETFFRLELLGGDEVFIKIYHQKFSLNSISQISTMKPFLAHTKQFDPTVIQQQKNKQPCSKMSKGPTQTHFLGRHTNSQQNITEYQGNTHENTVKYQQTLARTAVTRRTRDSQCWQGMKQRESSDTAGGNVNYSAVMQNSRDSLIFLKKSDHTTEQPFCWAQTQRKRNHHLREVCLFLWSYNIVHDSKDGNNLNVVHG